MTAVGCPGCDGRRPPFCRCLSAVLHPSRTRGRHRRLGKRHRRDRPRAAPRRRRTSPPARSLRTAGRRPAPGNGARLRPPGSPHHPTPAGGDADRASRRPQRTPGRARRQPLGRALFSPWYDTDQPVNNAHLVSSTRRHLPSGTGNRGERHRRPPAGRSRRGPYDRQLSVVGELPLAARTSGSAGLPTTSASTTPASRSCTTPSSATSTCPSSHFHEPAPVPAWSPTSPTRHTAQGARPARQLGDQRDVTAHNAQAAARP